jgi:hypothetical protein
LPATSVAFIAEVRFRRDLLEQAALVGSVGFNRLDEIGDQIAAPLELHVDAAEALAHEVAPANQAVETQ